MKIYYAHPIGSYGTFQEKTDLKRLVAWLGESCQIINPSDSSIQKDFDNWKKTKSKEDHDMRFFKALIKECDGLVFRGDTQGVRYEKAKAKEFDLPIFDLSDLDIIEGAKK